MEITLRLLYLVPEFPSQTHAFFWREVQALRSLGVEVSLVSTRRPSPGSSRHEFVQAASEQTLYLFPPEWLPDLLFLLARPISVLKALAYIAGLEQSSWLQRIASAPLILPAAQLARLSLERSANHLHVHSFANSAHVAALARILGGCAYSLTLHGDLEVYGRDHVHKTGLAAFVTCVTAPLKKQAMDQLGMAESRVHLVWMGVDTQRFKPKARSARQPQEPMRLLTVARLQGTKGHRFALRALKRLKDDGLDASYTIVGDGPAREEIEQEIVSLELTGSVKLVGTRSETEVLDLLHSSDALLLTSIGVGEAAPVAVMEAMACGLPVVCSIIGGTRDMIHHGLDGFLVEQEDVEGIAVCLRQLTESPDTASRIGQAARIRAVRDFDSYALATRLLHLIMSAGRAAD